MPHWMYATFCIDGQAILKFKYMLEKINLCINYTILWYNTCANFPSSSPLPHCYYLLELQLYNSGTLVCVMHLWDVMTFLTEVNKCAISWWYKIIFEWTRAAQPFLFYRIIKMHTSYLEFIWHTQTTHHLRTTALRIHRTSSVDTLKYNCKIRKP